MQGRVPDEAAEQNGPRRIVQSAPERERQRETRPGLVERHWHCDRLGDRETRRDRERQRETERDRERQRDRERVRVRERERDSE